MTWQPPRFTHQQRVATAHALTESLRQRHHDRLVAVMLVGSVSKDLDAPCSDLELDVVVKGAEDRWYPPFTRDGMSIDVSQKSPEAGLSDAGKVYYTWPISRDWLDGTVLYDPDGFYPKLRRVRDEAEAAADFSLLIRENLAYMYEHVLKLFALEPRQGLEATVFAGQVGYYGALAVALANKHHYLSTRRMIEESFTLDSLPAEYAECVAALLSAGPNVLEARNAVGRLWPVMLEWAASLGVRVDDEGALL